MLFGNFSSLYLSETFLQRCRLLHIVYMNFHAQIDESHRVTLLTITINEMFVIGLKEAFTIRH
ncbi:hypothetical protein KP509_23G027000 [Ceratopteris richardii]|uniref:Uncharacterized protein n=1 Tax=Ceratopteris richardii TaxID=49495 RepID=A0A8T2S0T2_CERRI|nr:hypothetical protein KP509_23G027000 [Ceratopteris richardii]